MLPPIPPCHGALGRRAVFAPCANIALRWCARKAAQQMRAVFGLSCTDSIDKSRAQTLWFCVLRGVRTPREDGCILLGVCRQTMHILMLHWLALLRQTCCSRIIWCRLRDQITADFAIVKNTILNYVCMKKKCLMCWGLNKYLFL